MEYKTTHRYVCDECMKVKGATRKPNKFTASKLPKNKMSEHIEKRVNGFLKNNDENKEAGYVHIRCVYSGEKQVDVKEGMKSKFVMNFS